MVSRATGHCFLESIVFGVSDAVMGEDEKWKGRKDRIELEENMSCGTRAGG